MNVISTVDAQSIVDNQMPREIEEGVHPFDKTCFLSNKRQWRRREKRPHYHEYGGVKQYNIWSLTFGSTIRWGRKFGAVVYYQPGFTTEMRSGVVVHA